MSQTDASLEERVSRLERQLDKLTAGMTSLPADVTKVISDGENPVRAIRRWRLMTQRELAEQADIGVNHVSRIENGAQFNMRTAKSLAAALDVRIDDISL
ncbi:MAG: helix-turn-helix transcriptional regulator [Pseudomonadota bacterium]